MNKSKKIEQLRALAENTTNEHEAEAAWLAIERLERHAKPRQKNAKVWGDWNDI